MLITAVQLMAVPEPDLIRITIVTPVPVLPMPTPVQKSVQPIQLVLPAFVQPVAAEPKTVPMTIVLAAPYTTILQPAVSTAAEEVVLTVPVQLLPLPAEQETVPCIQTLV